MLEFRGNQLNARLLNGLRVLIYNNYIESSGKYGQFAPIRRGELGKGDLPEENENGYDHGLISLAASPLLTINFIFNVIKKERAGAPAPTASPHPGIREDARFEQWRSTRLSQESHMVSAKRSPGDALIGLGITNYYVSHLTQPSGDSSFITYFYHLMPEGNPKDSLQVSANSKQHEGKADKTPAADKQKQGKDKQPGEDAAEKKVPTTKEQLIEMLKDQLDQVEDEISSMQNILEEERERRKELTSQLEEREKKITELIENEAKTLGDKVSEGLYKTLEAANKMRADTETEARRLAEDNTVLNEKILHRDNNGIQDRAKIVMNGKKLGSLQQKKVDAQRKKENLADKKNELEKQLNIMKQQFARIEKEEKQLRNQIQNMKMARLYLNKNLDGVKNGTGRRPAAGKSNAPDSFWTSQS